MNRSRLAQFSLDERVRVPVQFLTQTVAIATMWLVARNWVAPLLGIPVVSPIELVRTVSATVAPAILTEASTPASFSVMELMMGMAIWALPFFAVVCGVATLISALWYVVGRWIGPPAAPDVGGDA